MSRLVLNRRKEEKIELSLNGVLLATVIVGEISRTRTAVRLVVEADRSVTVLRGELADADRRRAAS